MFDSDPVAAAQDCRRIASFPVRALGGLIWLYQKTVSPALVVLNPRGGCRFSPTCSHYAAEALRGHGMLFGSWLTLRRLVKCGPWHPGGADPVPLPDHATPGQKDHRPARRPVPSCYSVRSP